MSDSEKHFEFDKEQLRVISLYDTETLVLAGPGCGKTTLLAARILHARQCHGISYESMLCLTFTNRAAREMAYRIKTVTGCRPDGLFIGNLHRFCSRFLYANNIISSDTTVMDEAAQAEYFFDAMHITDKTAWQEIVNHGIYLYQREHNFPTNVIRHPSTEASFDIAALTKRYRDYKRNHLLVDFDDLILFTFNTLYNNRNHNLLYSVYDWIEVDEVQDLTPMHLELIYMLLSDSPGRTAVYFGDERQAIFEFLGAGGVALTELYNRCKDNIICLNHNYRATRRLVELCNDFARQRLDVTPDTLPPPDINTSTPSYSDDLRLFEANKTNLMSAVCWLTREYLRNNADDSIGILTRTNFEAMQIAGYMTERNIPHRLIANNDLFSSASFKTVLAHLHVLHDRFNISAWARIMYQLKVFPTLKACKDFCDKMQNHHLSMDDILAYPGKSLVRRMANEDETNMHDLYKLLFPGVKGHGQKLITLSTLRSIAKIKAALQDDFFKRPDTVTVKRCLVKRYLDFYTGSRKRYLSDTNIDCEPLINELIRTYDFFLSGGFIKPLPYFDDIVSLYRQCFISPDKCVSLRNQLDEHLYELHNFKEADLVINDPHRYRVTIMTIHKAKGLEFDDVIVYNASNTRGGSLDSARVFYVAFSRARKRLAVFIPDSPNSSVINVKKHFKLISPEETDIMAMLEKSSY